MLKLNNANPILAGRIIAALADHWGEATIDSEILRFHSHFTRVWIRPTGVRVQLPNGFVGWMPANEQVALAHHLIERYGFSDESE
jgi:hypothetical protein